MRGRLSGTAGAWEQDYARRGRLWGGVRLDLHTSGFLESEPERRTGRWLDAGCGDGKGLVPLLGCLDGSARVVGMDVSRSALRHARRALMERLGADACSRVGLVEGDVRACPLGSAFFDVVRAVHLVGHFREQDRSRVMKTLVGLLRPGGRLLVSEFGRGDFRAGKGVEVEPGTMRRGTGIETHYFQQGELVALVEEAGARVESMSTERFHVEYAGERLPRERLDVLVAV
jgi:SAM-dependent methyltransferase